MSLSSQKGGAGLSAPGFPVRLVFPVYPLAIDVPERSIQPLPHRSVVVQIHQHRFPGQRKCCERSIS